MELIQNIHLGRSSALGYSSLHALQQHQKWKSLLRVRRRSGRGVSPKWVWRAEGEKSGFTKKHFLKSAQIYKVGRESYTDKGGLYKRGLRFERLNFLNKRVLTLEQKFRNNLLIDDFALILPLYLVNVANLLPLLDPPPGHWDLPQRTPGLPRQGDRGGVRVAGVVEEGGHAGVEGGAEDGPGHSARGQVADLCRESVRRIRLRRNVFDEEGRPKKVF